MLEELVTDIKTAAVVSGVTTTAGVGTWFEFIPNDIGKLASLFGLILSLILLYTHLRKNNRDQRSNDLDMEIKSIQLAILKSGE